MVTEEMITNKTTVNPFLKGDSQSNSVNEDEIKNNTMLLRRYDINNSNLLMSKEKTALSTGRIAGVNRNNKNTRDILHIMD